MKIVSLESYRASLYSISFIDGLTQLNNREGFLCAGGELLDVSDAVERWAFLLSLKVEHLKFINHALGKEVGDKLLIRTALLLRQVFRKSAVIGRIGGDEFAVLGRLTGPSACSAIIARLNEAIDAGNSSDRTLNLSLRGGFSQFDTRHPKSLTERMQQADTAMNGVAAKLLKSNNL
jgi:diguanylate cyclase (GGDEF)-like protein